MSTSPFTSRAKRAVQKLAGVPVTPVEEFMHPWHRWVPGAEPVVDRVETFDVTPEEFAARSGNLSEVQVESFKALARIEAPAARPAGRAIGGDGNGVVTSWAGAR